MYAGFLAKPNENEKVSLKWEEVETFLKWDCFSQDWNHCDFHICDRSWLNVASETG